MSERYCAGQLVMWCFFSYSVGSLDGRAIGNGVGKGDTELDHIGAALLHGQEDIGGLLGQGETGRDIGDKRSLLRRDVSIISNKGRDEVHCRWKYYKMSNIPCSGPCSAQRSA